MPASRFEGVPAASPRAFAGYLLLILIFLGVFLFPLLDALELIATGDRPPTFEISQAALYVNLAFTLVALVALPALYLVAVRPRVRLSRELRLAWDRRTLLWVLAGAGLAVALLFAIAVVLATLQQAGLFEAEESELFRQLRGVLTLELVFLLPLGAALTEEIFFRGFLQPRLGLAASSLLFGLVHIGYGTALQVVAPVLIGFFLGALYRFTRSLWAPIAAHFTFDFLQLAATYFLGE